MSSEKNLQTEEQQGSAGREQRVKTILVTQPKPEGDKSHSFYLAKKPQVKIEFRSFFHFDGISSNIFRTYKINKLDNSAVSITVLTGVDNFFPLMTKIENDVPAYNK